VNTGEENKYRLTSDQPIALFEPTFAPRSPDAPEADGYLIVPVSHFMSNTSEYQLFDTSDLSNGPIARIELPFQMGWTPHGHWLGFDEPAVAQAVGR
jgi:carotenoid cleavage dioxygenase